MAVRRIDSMRHYAAMFLAWITGALTITDAIYNFKRNRYFLVGLEAMAFVIFSTIMIRNYLVLMGG